MNVADLPGEMVSHIMAFLTDEAFCSARLAHRRFCVDPMDRVLNRRAVPRWLRVPSSDLCVKGRADAVRFLCERHYALYAHPFTAEDIVAAASAGHADTVAALMENTRSAKWWQFHPRAMDEAAAAGHSNVVDVFYAFGLVPTDKGPRGACCSTRRTDAGSVPRHAAKYRRRAISPHAGPRMTRTRRKGQRRQGASGLYRAPQG